MPELPEVETVRRSLVKFCLGKTVADVTLSGARMRLNAGVRAFAPLKGAQLVAVSRRAKYLLLNFTGGTTLIVHLGMSGTLRLCAADDATRKHDHLRLLFSDGNAACLNDPRRFGLALPCPTDSLHQHPLLRNLGHEPLDPGFTGRALHAGSRRKSQPLKNYLMDQRQVVGVGNIYASESLFRARLSPRKKAGSLTLPQATLLAASIKAVLRAAIRKGGTTLNDFVSPEGNQGYFSLQLMVYGRAALPCPLCRTPVRRLVQAGRATFYCPACQT